VWCRVLLVDDEPHVVNALRRELLRKPDIGHDGLEIETFGAPEAALARVRESDSAFDIVIADYHMRNLDGVDFLSQVHAIQPEAVRILITGSADLDGAIKAINEARIDFLILKPWSEFDLKGRIALALHRRRTQLTASAAAVAQPLRSSPYRVMLVDDETAVLKSLEREISKGGQATGGAHPLFRVSLQSSPSEALLAAAEDSPDLVISDYAMPEMDGVTFFHRLRELCPSAVRIMISGRADVGILVAAINEAGVYHFLRKPWSSAELTATLAQALVYRDILTECEIPTRDGKPPETAAT
jgi:DNA-binding NtrC family response regulator